MIQEMLCILAILENMSMAVARVKEFRDLRNDVANIKNKKTKGFKQIKMLLETGLKDRQKIENSKVGLDMEATITIFPIIFDVFFLSFF